MAKLPSGTRRRKDGSLEKRFTVNGKRYSIYASNTKELAEKEQETREQIKNNAYSENKNITLDKYFLEWIDHKKKSVKENTIHNYTSHYKNYISGSLGNKKIVKIERREILAFQTVLTGEMSASSANHVIIVLKAILSDAVCDGIISKNPCSEVKSIKSTGEKATETKHRALTPGEQEVFMSELKPSYYYNYIALMLASGMRSGEVGALTWGDIDYKNNVIHVTRTVTKDSKGKYIIGDSTKTESGKRDIPITETIRGILGAQKKYRGLLPFPGNNIFVSVNGGIIGNVVINNEIKRTIKRINSKAEKQSETNSKQAKHIEPFTSHALRDTFATRYIEQGGNMKTLQRILGHASITMTMDLYCHVLPDTMQEEMQKINIAI